MRCDAMLLPLFIPSKSRRVTYAALEIPVCTIYSIGMYLSRVSCRTFPCCKLTVGTVSSCLRTPLALLRPRLAKFENLSLNLVSLIIYVWKYSLNPGTGILGYSLSVTSCLEPINSSCALGTRAVLYDVGGIWVHIREVKRYARGTYSLLYSRLSNMDGMDMDTLPYLACVCRWRRGQG